MTERMEVILLGRFFGTASGWDEMFEAGYQFYDFEPATGVNLPSVSCLGVLYDQGLIEGYNDSGEVGFSYDLVEVISTNTLDKRKPSQ